MRGVLVTILIFCGMVIAACTACGRQMPKASKAEIERFTQAVADDKAVEVAAMLRGRNGKALLKERMNGQSPFVYACRWQRADVLKVLILNGVDTKEKDRIGLAPLFVTLVNVDGAGTQKSYETVKILIDNGANVMDTIDNGETTLMLACKSGNSRTARLLIDRGVKVNASSRRGFAALMEGAESDEVVRMLLKKGAHVNAANDMGFTPLMYAIPSREAVALLLNNGANVNAKNDHERTPLMIACLYGNWPRCREVAELLVEKGADVNATDRKGNTLLKIVSDSLSSGHERELTVAFLREHGGRF